MENINEEKLYEIQFVQLILSLKTSAIMQLGKIANPLTGKIERNLNEAKYTIDMINMLKEKTKDNLKDDEKKIIDNTIFELQMNYIDEVKKGEEEKEETKPEEKEPKEGGAEKQEPKESYESKEHEEKEKKPEKKVKEKLDKKKKSKRKKEK